MRSFEAIKAVRPVSAPDAVDRWMLAQDRVDAAKNELNAAKEALSAAAEPVVAEFIEHQQQSVNRAGFSIHLRRDLWVHLEAARDFPRADLHALMRAEKDDVWGELVTETIFDANAESDNPRPRERGGRRTRFR